MVKRMQFRGNQQLISSGKCERYVFKTVGMASNLLKETMLSFEFQEGQKGESEDHSAPNNDV